MSVLLATWIVDAATAYLVTGAVFVAIVLPRLVVRLDDGLRDAHVTVRLLIAPGLLLLWPLFVVRLVSGGHPPDERNAHRRAARIAHDSAPDPALQQETEA
jgi:hypothetical protein